MAYLFGVVFLLIAGGAYCAPPKIPCPAPVPPEHGQAFLKKEGLLVKFECEEGYALEGDEMIRCIDGKWEEPNPVCLEIGSEYKESPKTTENEDTAQLSNSTKDEMLKDVEGYQSDDSALRQLYWYAHYYGTGAPAVMTLTDSQIAWINSLHPELRDQYLKNAYIMRIGSSSEPERGQALVARDAYDYVYHVPYVRRPVSLIIDNVASTYDYTCNQAGFPVIPAPDLPNMHVARYDSRKNVYAPHNYYLSAVYQCDPGYYMLDSRFSELYCSRGQWVGASPVCVPNP